MGSNLFCPPLPFRCISDNDEMPCGSFHLPPRSRCHPLSYTRVYGVKVVIEYAPPPDSYLTATSRTTFRSKNAGISALPQYGLDISEERNGSRPLESTRYEVRSHSCTSLILPTLYFNYSRNMYRPFEFLYQCPVSVHISGV